MNAQAIQVGEGDPAFREPVAIERQCLEFRRRPILLRHNARSFVVGPNEVTLWNRGDVYERRAIERDSGDVLVRYTFEGGAPFVVHYVPCNVDLFLEERLGHLECGSVAAALKAAASPPHSKIEHVKFVLSQSQTRVSLRQIAADLGWTPYHLSRVFRDVTGFSMTQYRQQLRLRMAFERIIAAGNLYEIANDLGFADQSHFTRTFRRVFGAAPGAFRRRIANPF